MKISLASVVSVLLFPFASVQAQNVSYIDDLRAGLPLTCFPPGGIYHYFVAAEDCKRAVKLMLFGDKTLLDPVEWRIRSRVPGVRNLPLTTEFRTCKITVDAEDPFFVSFSTIRAAFFLSELIQECVTDKKYPLGGRVDIRVGTVYVGIIGTDPGKPSLSTNSTLLFRQRLPVSQD